MKIIATTLLAVLMLSGCTYLSVWDTPYGDGVYIRVGSTVDARVGSLTNNPPWLWVRGAPDADVIEAAVKGAVEGLKK